MKLVWLCRYISGMLTLLFFFNLLITWAPAAEHVSMLVGVILGCGALIALGFATMLNRLPRGH